MKGVRFFKSDKAINSFFGQLIYISYLEYKKNIVLNKNNFVNLLYIQSGKGKILINESYFDIFDNCIIVLYDRESDVELFFDDVSAKLFIMGINNFPPNPLYRIFDTSCIKKQLDAYLEQLILSTDNKISENLIKDMLPVIQNYSIYDILKPIEAAELTVPVECYKVKSFIDNNYKNNVNLDILAEIVHMNKYYISHMFTKFFYTSPINYLIKKRITNGEELLLSTQKTISDISLMSGFASHSYFSQVFKRYCGISPTEYREKNIKKDNLYV